MLSSYVRKYPLISMPQPYQRFNSLKCDNFQPLRQSGQTHMHKRHSLDSKHNKSRHRHSSFIDNVEESLITSKQMGSKVLGRGTKVPHQDNLRVKYYWRGKSSKSTKREGKVQRGKVKKSWSELGKRQSKKEKLKQVRRSKYQDFSKINMSDRLQTKQQIANGKSYQSFKAKRQPSSGSRIKTKSLLNSTMLTKRQSEQRRSKGQNKYQEMIMKLKSILEKYQRKVKQLKEQKEFYRLKLKRERRGKENV